MKGQEFQETRFLWKGTRSICGSSDSVLWHRSTRQDRYDPIYSKPWISQSYLGLTLTDLVLWKAGTTGTLSFYGLLMMVQEPVSSCRTQNLCWAVKLGVGVDWGNIRTGIGPDGGDEWIFLAAAHFGSYPLFSGLANLWRGYISGTASSGPTKDRVGSKMLVEYFKEHVQFLFILHGNFNIQGMLMSSIRLYLDFTIYRNNIKESIGM